MRAEMLEVRDRGLPEKVVTTGKFGGDEPLKAIGAELRPVSPKPAAPPLRRVEARAAEGQQASIAELVSQLWLVARRQWLLLALGLVLGAALAPLAIIALPPLYKSTATIMLDTSRIQLFPQQGVLGDAPFDNSAAIESQLEVMRSDRIARKVIEALKLDKDAAFKVAAEGRTARLLGPTMAEILGRPVLRSPERIERFRIDRLNSMIEVRRVSGTFAVDIIASSDDSKLAAALANAVAAAYLSESIEHKQHLNNRAMGWMGGRIDEVREQLEAAQKAVASYRAASSLKAVDEERFSDARIRDLEGQLGAAKAAALDARVRLDRITEAISSKDVLDIGAVLPDIKGNADVEMQRARYRELYVSGSMATEKLRETYLDLRTRYDDWTKRFGKKHELIERLGARLQSVREALQAEYHRQADGFRGEYEISTKRAAALEKELESALDDKHHVESVRLRLKELEGAVQVQQRTLDSLLARQAETNEQRSFPIARAWVLNEATEPVKKVLKRTLQAAFVLFGLGVGLGFGGAALREFSDRSFRRMSELHAVFPRAIVEVLPTGVRRSTSPKPGSALPAPATNGFEAENNRQRLSRSQGLFWSALDDPGSLYARSIRSIRYNLDRVAGEPGGHVIGVTGAGPGVGASSTAAAVALVSASTGTRTLLIDCNLSDTSLTRELARDANQGLIEVVRGAINLEDAVLVDPTTSLHFLPAVVDAGVVGDQVVASHRLAELIAHWRTEHDLVVVDLPPLAHPIGVGLSRNFITSYIVVAQWGHSSIGAVRETIQRHALDPTMFSLAVLSQVKPKAISKYDPEVYRRLVA